jgi:hypothetical protein
MSAILTRVEIGQQGSLPGEVLMSSTDDLATITSPGYLKPNEGGVTLLPTDFITAVYGTPLVNKQQFTPVFNGTEITLVAIGGGGSINGAENIGTGQGLLGVSGDNITGKGLLAGANISVTPSGNDLVIAATGSGGGTITGIVDVGTGTGHLAAGTAGTNVQVKTLVAGNDIVVTESGTTVTIASTAGNNGLTNLANLPGGEGIFAGLVGTVAQLKSIAGGAGIDITASGNNIIITNTGGGGGSNFEYENAQWVAKNGNDDTNDGLSINTPKLTVQAAISALGGNGIIHIEDNGTYTGAWNIGGNDITIDAPAAFLNTSGVTASSGAIFKVNAYSFGTNFNNIISSANIVVYINAEKVRGNYGNGTTNPSQLFINAQEITSDFTITTNASVILKFDSLAGDIVDTSPLTAAAPPINIFGYAQTGNITSTNVNIGGFLQFSSGTPTITGIRQGYFNGVYYGDQENTGTWFNDGPVNGQPYNVVIWNTAQTNVLNGSNYKLYSNAYINYIGNNGYGRFDLTNDAAVPVGFKCWMFQNVNDNQTGVLSSGIGGVANIISPSTVPGVAYTRRNGSWLLLTKVAQSGGVATFNVSGDLWQSNLSSSTVNVFVSQIDGDDASADGSINQQFATINAALAYVIATYTATPAHGINITITDDAMYNEKLDFTGTSNIQLIGRTAQISYTSSGPGDDGFTSNAPEQFVSVASLITSGGGKTVNYTGAGALILNVDILGGGNVENNGPGLMLAQAYSLQGTTVNSGGGEFRYTTIVRSGADGAGIIGNSSDGASQDWTVLRNLRASDSLFVASTPVAINVASLTITAALLQDRIIVNNDAGPSTWTLDTATNLTAAYPGIQDNDSFSVFVSNTTGATITFANSSGTTVTGAPTSALGFTFWMRYVGGSWELYY